VLIIAVTLVGATAMEIARRREMAKAEAAREEAKRLEDATDLALAKVAAQ